MSMQSSGQRVSPVTDILEFYTRVRAYTEHLCEPLETEDYIPQPIVDVSPAKWNIAHTTWFFEEMVLKNFVPGYKVFDENFGFLFNSYYNSVGMRTRRDHRGDLSRPTVRTVFEYRKHVDEKMRSLLGNNVTTENPQSAIHNPQLAGLVTLGLNHEQQHQELFLTDLKYMLSVNPLFPVYRENYSPEETVESGPAGFIEIQCGVREIGYDGDEFCFDNELDRHKVYLDDFFISNRLVTNAEFIEFIDAGGYRDPLLWHSEGWDWVNQNEVTSPLYWQPTGRNASVNELAPSWYQYTLGGLRLLQPEAPVCHISYYEAAAFAEWKGMRLPTEFEWEAASGQLNWGKRWEWTNSAYLPYPGFTKAAGAVGEYNGKFMINQMVLRGASVATSEGHSRPTYRNFFHPHLRWQFTGLRLVK